MKFSRHKIRFYSTINNLMVKLIFFNAQKFFFVVTVHTSEIVIIDFSVEGGFPSVQHVQVDAIVNGVHLDPPAQGAFRGGHLSRVHS